MLNVSYLDELPTNTGIHSNWNHEEDDPHSTHYSSKRDTHRHSHRHSPHRHSPHHHQNSYRNIPTECDATECDATECDASDRCDFIGSSLWKRVGNNKVARWNRYKKSMLFGKQYKEFMDVSNDDLMNYMFELHRSIMTVTIVGVVFLALLIVLMSLKRK